MNIACKKCGLVIAERLGNIFKVKGQPVPTENLDGVILKCDCGRTRTYYLREDDSPEKIKNLTSLTLCLDKTG